MESFLKLVAADLYKHTEGNLAHTAVVFPNKRAGLFFNEYLGLPGGYRERLKLGSVLIPLKFSFCYDLLILSA